jgi:outer membrane lipase/esterase
MRILKLIVTTFALALATETASAGPFSRLWVFGDSNVDTGWYKIAPWSGSNTFDIYLQQSSTYGIGKPTTNPGPISVQVLARILGHHARPANQGGTNYASGGARNHDTNYSGSGLFPNAVPTETQIDNYIATHTPSGKALYVITSGDNDVNFAVNNPNDYFGDPAVIGAAAVEANQEAYVLDAADSLASKIASVQANNNVKYLIVTKLAESFGTPALKMQLRAEYNAELKGQLDSLGVQYAWADVNTVRQQVNANPAAFGINSLYLGAASGQRACTDPVTGPDPNLAISSGWAFLCSPTSPVSNPISNTIAKEAMFADDGHFATGGQRIIGSYYYCLAKKTWPQLFATSGPPPHHPPIACSKFFPPSP